jgi:hypothetical protein
MQEMLRYHYVCIFVGKLNQNTVKGKVFSMQAEEAVAVARG